MKTLNFEEAVAADLCRKSLDHYSALGWGQRAPRIPGALSPSMAGKCPRQVVTQLLGRHPGCHDPRGDRTMELGSALHEVIAKALAQYTGTMGGQVLALPPMRVHTWGEGFSSGYTGTPDDLVVHFPSGKLFVLDHKTTAESSFRKRIKEPSKDPKVRSQGPDPSHLMQVAVYAASDEVQALALRLGLDVIPMVVYWSKDDLSPFAWTAGPHDRDQAQAWAIEAHGRIQDAVLGDGILPEVPQDAYQCAYCPLWPALTDTIHPTIKERTEALRALGELNYLRCASCTTVHDILKARTSLTKEDTLAVQPT